MPLNNSLKIIAKIKQIRTAPKDPDTHQQKTYLFLGPKTQKYRWLKKEFFRC
jgi:hypothetical protein